MTFETSKTYHPSLYSEALGLNQKQYILGILNLISMTIDPYKQLQLMNLETMLSLFI